MPNLHRRAAAVVAAAVLSYGLSACGSSAGDSSVALQAGAADPQPTARGGDGGDGGDGGQGGSGGSGGDEGADGAPAGPELDPAVAAAPPTLRACLTRNDQVVPWRDDLASAANKRWHSEHRQAAHVRIITAVYRRLGGDPEITGKDLLGKGLLGYDLDVVGNRLFFQVDPELVDLDEFRAWLERFARKANKAAHVRGAALTMTVQPGCFPAARYEEVYSWVRGHFREAGVYEMHGQANLAGRIEIGLKDADAVAALQKRFGPIVDAEIGNPVVAV